MNEPTPADAVGWISIEHCSEHNLKDISLKIPLGKTTLVCGVSGSGKSTLAHDVCFAEGQGRFLESFSSYARIFHSRLSRSQTRTIRNIPPALALEQLFLSHNPRSTVLTLSDLYSPLRMLFSRFASANDPVKVSRSHLSYNHPLGACPECQGLGKVHRLDHSLIIRDENLSLRQGALRLSTPKGYIIYSQVTIDVLDQVCQAHGFSVDIPWKDLDESQQKIVLYGSDRLLIPFGKHPLESRLKWSGITAKPRELGHYKGIIPVMEDILNRDPNPNILRWCRKETCPACSGLRLNPRVHELSYGAVLLRTLLSFSVQQLALWAKGVLMDTGIGVAERDILKEIEAHTMLLETLRLGHLQLLRPVPSLSPGEVQGIRLASLLRNPISDMLYVLDEPASSLHPQERQAVYEQIRLLQKNNCTVLLVSHDRNALKYVDWVLEMGPGGGEEGGRLLFSGSANAFALRLTQKSGKSPTLTAWSRELPTVTAKPIARDLQILSEGYGLVTVISGPTGSGKTSLLKQLEQRIQAESTGGGKVVMVDQKPLGKNSRSNPATYTGLFDDIRTLFARQEAAMLSGLTASAFSFNSELGACPSCQGSGTNEITLHHLTPLNQVCDACQGRRYQPHVLSVRFRGLAIDEVLNLTILNAMAHFAGEGKIMERLKILADMGLGYLTLGQPSSSLSGGEAQRVRLSSFINPGKTDRTLYLLDEPCKGLHDLDVPILLRALNSLGHQGAAVVVAENNPVFIAGADRILSLANLSSDKPHREDKEEKPVIGDMIVMRGVRTRNLKNITVGIPKERLTVVAGPSGSGKSALLHETLYNACQRRYAEHLSPYLRDRLAQGGHGDFDDISPVVPALYLGSHQQGANPRSTVGTLSGTSDTLRVLFSRIGRNKQSPISGLRASDFSFNHPDGSCPTCTGIGSVTRADSRFWLADEAKNIFNGAFANHKSADFFFNPDGRYLAECLGAAKAMHMDLFLPWNRLDSRTRSLILDGQEGEFDVLWLFRRGKRQGEQRYRAGWPGFNKLILETHFKRKSHKKQQIDFHGVIQEIECPDCKGLRLKTSSLQTQVGEMTFETVQKLSINRLFGACSEYSQSFFKGTCSGREHTVCSELMPLLMRQLEQMITLGLGYLNLARAADSLSFGELQRVRLASFLGNRLSHCLFILDEISRGLHPLDIEQMISVVRSIGARSNSIVASDHHPLVQQAADWIIEMGPGSGNKGGKIVYTGPVKTTNSGHNSIQVPGNSRSAGRKIGIRNALANNLRHIDIDIPLSGITLLCGVSGSGKTSLLKEVILNSFLAEKAVNCSEIYGLSQFASVYFLNQQAAARQTKERVFDFLLLKKRLLGLFGRKEPEPCPQCQGEGDMVNDLDYMGTYRQDCPHCFATGYDPLSVSRKRNEMTFIELLRTEIDSLAAELPQDFELDRELNLLREFSLGHISLSRKTATLSIGERQRLRLLQVLLKLGDQPALLLLDEPDGGLGTGECRQLLDSLRHHAGKKHSVLAISHHPLFMAEADWLIDLGPLAGEEGGMICAQGTPAELLNGKWPRSRTAVFMKKHFTVHTVTS